MSIPTKIVINPIAVPNVKTDGYLHIRHETEPDWLILDITWQIIKDFLILIGEAASSISLIEAGFQRSHLPGELELVLMLYLPLPGGEPLVISKRYSYISSDHMQEPSSLKEFLIDPLRNDLAKAFAKRSAEIDASARKVDELLKYTGPPDYGDLY